MQTTPNPRKRWESSRVTMAPHVVGRLIMLMAWTLYLPLKYPDNTNTLIWGFARTKQHLSASKSEAIIMDCQQQASGWYPAKDTSIVTRPISTHRGHWEADCTNYPQNPSWVGICHVGQWFLSTHMMLEASLPVRITKWETTRVYKVERWWATAKPAAWRQGSYHMMRKIINEEL